jgi:lipopolysaccharide export system protein LptC
LRARRHSHRVRLLRILIPIVLAAGLVVAVLAVVFNPLRLLSDLPVSIKGLSVSRTGMTMTGPELSGFTRDRRRYELTANSAAQDLRNINMVHLDEPRASLEMSDGSMVNMQAAMGAYDRNEGILTLERNIVLTSTSGYEIRLQRAVIDVRGGSILSDRPVEMRSQNGTLRANRLEVTKSPEIGEVVRMEGDVVLNFTPSSDETPGKKAPQ